MMNKAAIKKYAPAARKAFIATVTRRAELLGLDPDAPPSIEHDGDVMLINGQAFSAEIESQRDALEQRIAREGFDVVMDAMAYTWFNRLVAIRYMELHGYLGHGYRVLSHPHDSDGQHNQPEILGHLTDVELSGLNKAHALDLKLAGNRDEELYREVLLAQCHDLHTAMPFLFEPIDDATELLLPDGLLRTDSLIRQLVTAIDEESWQHVEIIGWLYQFYISEKKDQVIGKVVKSEDIPAATQLFTPNWIVQYLVQNSLGRLWLMANPNSQLASKWEYYIRPAEQAPEVNAQLDALIQARIAEDGSTLNPETLTLLDPACGSGHILVEAYDLLRDIYLERGYRRQDIPRLILEKNLYGLEIDDRASQLAGFALLMKARADDRRLLRQPVALNVLALQEAKADSANEVNRALNAPQISNAAVSQLVETFDQAKTFGSLIQLPDELATALPGLRRKLEAVRDGDDMLGRDAAETLLRLVAQAEVLARQFDAVVANPPYLGARYQSAELKGLLSNSFQGSNYDVFSAFLERGAGFTKGRSISFYAAVTPISWMFLSDFERFRTDYLDEHSISNIVKLEYNSFEPAAVAVSAWVSLQHVNIDLKGRHVDLGEFKGADVQHKKTLEAISRLSSCPWFYETPNTVFHKIPGKPLSFWLSEDISAAFSSASRLGSKVEITGSQNVTGNNAKFLRLWHEVDAEKIGASDSHRWCLYAKGGNFRRWAGNIEWVVDWSEHARELYRSNTSSSLLAKRFWYREGISYTDITTLGFTARYLPEGCVYDKSGPSLHTTSVYPLLAFLNSSPVEAMLGALNPTMHCQVRDLSLLPYDVVDSIDETIAFASAELVKIHTDDWNSSETAIDFESLDWIYSASDGLIAQGVEIRAKQLADAFNRVSRLQSENDNYFCNQFRIGELERVTKSGPRVTLRLLNKYSQDVASCEGVFTHIQPAVVRQAMSFAIGCMMGRYSLDAPGLIYAHAGNEGFDPSRYETFPADDDGIVPITDEAWFDDDGANRIREFVRVVWGENTEVENMAWLAESLGGKASESADDTIRRYLSRDFYKDHLQTYKKRPIYWLFSSGKHKAFEALVYLHRYNAGTLSRMRMQYVVPLQSKMQSRIDRLDEDVQSSGSSAEQKRLQKQRDKLAKQLDELRRFDEELRHYADQRISLDLDDGVKVNYGKFGGLLAEVKLVTGQK